MVQTQLQSTGVTHQALHISVAVVLWHTATHAFSLFLLYSRWDHDPETFHEK